MRSEGYGTANFSSVGILRDLPKPIRVNDFYFVHCYNGSPQNSQWKSTILAMEVRNIRNGSPSQDKTNLEAVKQRHVQPPCCHISVWIPVSAPWFPNLVVQTVRFYVCNYACVWIMHFFNLYTLPVCDRSSQRENSCSFAGIRCALRCLTVAVRLSDLRGSMLQVANRLGWFYDFHHHGVGKFPNYKMHISIPFIPNFWLLTSPACMCSEGHGSWSVCMHVCVCVCVCLHQQSMKVKSTGLFSARRDGLPPEQEHHV